MATAAAATVVGTAAAPATELLPPAEALREILACVRTLPVERCPVAPSLAGRVLAEDAAAQVSLPPFATSAMDGYAVRSADRFDEPIPIVGHVAAGDPPAALGPGEAMGIATGAPLPDGADAVVPIEDAEERDGRLLAARPKPRAFVREAGGDVRAGDVVARKGGVLGPAALAALTASGVERVAVAVRPRVAALATGSELRRLGEPLGPGQIYESNGVGLDVQTARAGGQLVLSEIVPDDVDETRRAFARAIDLADVVISSGGVSVGPHDHVKPVLRELGVEEVFWRIAHKPGKPLWFGVDSTGVAVFGLPGNPVSCLVTFELFIRPALCVMQGAQPSPRPVARLASPVRRLGNRDHAVRCRLVPGADGMALIPAGAQESHLIAHAAAADAIAIVERGPGEAAAGTLVEYLPL